MIVLLVLCVLGALGAVAFLGRTVDSRDGAQKLWLFERTRPYRPKPAPARSGYSFHDARRRAVPQHAREPITRPTNRRS